MYMPGRPSQPRATDDFEQAQKYKAHSGQCDQIWQFIGLWATF